MTIARRQPQIIVAVLGAVLIVTFFALSARPSAATVDYGANSLLGLAAVLAGLRWNVGSSDRRGWALFAAGIALYVAGDLAWCVAELVPGAADVSDVLYLAAYPFFAVGLLAFAAQHREPEETTLRQLLDAAILFVAAFSAVWVFAIGPASEGAGSTAPERVLTVLYPTLDLVLLALITRLALSTSRWPAALRLLALGFGAMFVGDLVWRMLLARGTYAVSSAGTAAFMAAFVFFSAAILDPSAARSGRIEQGERGVPVLGRLALLAFVVLVPAAVVGMADTRIDSGADRIVVTAVLVLLPLLILVRVWDLVGSLRRTTADLDLIVASSPIPIAVADRDGAVRLWNRAAERVSGYAAVDVIGAPSPIEAADDAEHVAALYREALAGTALDRVSVKLRHQDGHPLDIRVSTAPLQTRDGRVVALFEDVTQERLHREAMDFAARHDALTGLPNRLAFGEEVATHRERFPEDDLHVVLLDVDNFKSLNETSGLATGDEILRRLGQILRSRVRARDLVARLSGDEFALLLEAKPDEDPDAVVGRVLDAARDFRYETDAGDIDVTLSAGLYTLAPGDTTDLALRRADEALYQAKVNGRNRLERWVADSSPTIHVARTWSPFIKDALRDGRIRLYLQPVVSLVSGEVAFYEALARLISPKGEVLAAGLWIEHAEELGFMPAIDAHMLEQARRVIAEHSGARLLVNVSASSFHDAEVVEILVDALARVPEGSLGIEITEHAALKDGAAAPVTLRRLRDLGATVAIDDFGVGFTSFRELAALPCDIVKIPGALAGGSARHNADAEVIAAAITKVAHHYRKAVVIEAVETAEDADRARALGIEYGQGWHFARPAPPDEVFDALPGAAPASVSYGAAGEIAV